MIDPKHFGVSFSIKQCRAFQLKPDEVLGWLIEQGFRRFRLMSYWDEIEATAGTYDFTALDKQLKQIHHAGGIVSLSIGIKQPRWPEYHWPDWALHESPEKVTESALNFINATVNRYKTDLTIVSWQLENEALLKGFGRNIVINRPRLIKEYALVKRLDTSRPLIMSTSNGWGLPIRQPRPDIVGFSYYAVMFEKGAYHRTIHRPWLYKLRKALINRPVFMHELQCEPWGPQAIWEMSVEEQYTSMSPSQIVKNIRDAQSIGATPIDLWGGEWWCWLATMQRRPAVIEAVKLACQA